MNKPKPIGKPMHGKYRDEYGTFWHRIDEYRVWSSKYGTGGWFGGRGLELYER